jgi:RNA polymerase sigma factor (sigma-70 family)
MMHGPHPPAWSRQGRPAPPPEDVSDRALLDRFVRHRDDAAFESLVRRYGPLVLGVCRRVLGDGPDAEDAFQATFLVLVDRAGSLARPELLGNWLYGVAYRVARKARAKIARRARKEGQAPPAVPADPQLEAAWRELWSVLDEEMQRLPERYRAPLTLCYLDGLSNQDAARRLGWPIGSISYRLARARDMLRERLQRRCPGLPPAMMVVLPVWNGSAEVAGELLEATVNIAVRLAADARETVETLTPTVRGLVAAGRAARRPRSLRLLVALLLGVVLLGAGLAVYAGVSGRPAERPPGGCCGSGQESPPTPCGPDECPSSCH